MSIDHAIRVTLPYDDCKDIISIWADRCSQAIVYQHDADGEISKTHVHIGLVGCEVKAEALKRMWPDAPGKGNEFWSFKEWIRKDLTNWATTPDTYIAYMSKGVLRPVFVKNFSNDKVENSRQSWVEPVKADKTGDSSQYDINTVLKLYDGMSFMTHYARDHIEETPIASILERVRRDTFKYLYAKKRIVPHASHYKIIASSVFMRLCERLNREEEAISALQNLWY